MTKFEVESVEKLQQQLEGLYVEMTLLARNLQDSPVNYYKMRYVNQILSQANGVLGESRKPFKGFTTYEGKELPTNNEVAIMLAQYLNCLKKFRIDIFKQPRVMSHHWVG